MKKLSLVFLTAVLSLLLAGSAAAGNIAPGIRPGSAVLGIRPGPAEWLLSLAQVPGSPDRAEDGSGTALPLPDPDPAGQQPEVEAPVLTPGSAERSGPHYAAATFDLSFFLALIAAVTLLGATFSRKKD